MLLLEMSRPAGPKPYIFNLHDLESAIEEGQDVNQKDAQQNTPLMIYSLYGNKNAVQLLLEAGADVNLVNKNGETALMFAISAQNYDIVKMLIDSGAELNKVDKDGKTAIMHAAELTGNAKSLNIFKLLLNTDLFIRDNAGKIVIQYLTENPNKHTSTLIQLVQAKMTEQSNPNYKKQELENKILMHANAREWGKVLNLKNGNTKSNIATKYKKLALMFHPDKNPTRNTTRTFQAIGAAFNALKGGTRKQKYSSRKKTRKNRK